MIRAPHHKYKAKRCVLHEGRHASLKECRTFGELQLMERAGEIRGLREQVAIELAPSVVLFGRKKPALRIVIDYVYERQPDHVKVYHDCKGMETDVWRVKAHLLALKVAPEGAVVVKS